tara:strand:+ start:347 stop:1270 length:924 start_codon:yes stop_codon:yes gene_type:complete
MAIPSSGTISLAGIRAELATNTYNASATTTASLEDCSDGTVATINTGNASGDRPNGSAPHAMSEFYAYDHDLSSFTDNISFDLDGANDYLEGDSGLVAAIPTTTGSISCWVKIDTTSANGLIWALNISGNTQNQIFLLYHNGSGVIRGNFKGANVANIVDSSTGLENDGNWHHFVMTWQASSKASGNIVKLYEDGSLQDSDTIAQSQTFSGTPNLFGFGRNALQNNGQNFNGHINDMAIFNDVLTASEVTSIYNSGSPKDESGHSGLQAYYTLEGYSNGDTEVSDDSSNSHTLTITNSTDIDSTDTP